MLISTKTDFFPRYKLLYSKWNLENFQQKPFSVVHLYIHSMSKNFESFREFLDSLCFSFSAIFYQRHDASLTKFQIQISKYLAK